MEKKAKKIILIILLCFIVIVIFTLTIFLIITLQTPKTEETYNPQINPNDFASKINNRYLALTPGKKFVYKGETEEGTERVEVYATHDTKKVMGVNAIVVRDRVWLNDELIEDTKDWFAQDKYGNVWYFGEDSKEIVNGKIVSTKGSWEAGVNGAKPGIVMKANPQVGDIYRQEYYPGEAEDMAEILGFGAKVNVPYGTFENCLQTREWSPLEPGSDEHKYYCPGVGSVVLEVGIKDQDKVYLVDVITDAEQTQTKLKEEPLEELKTEITGQEAIEIALKAVEGEVTDVAIEKKFGKAAYVVEIDADGTETDVIIDIETGKVLGIET